MGDSGAFEWAVRRGFAEEGYLELLVMIVPASSLKLTALVGLDWYPRKNEVSALPVIRSIIISI